MKLRDLNLGDFFEVVDTDEGVNATQYGIYLGFEHSISSPVDSSNFKKLHTDLD